ncbi:hypothetical protein GCM10009574_084540 [Streptomyces asiaticus]|uniref:Uncharacterized protein n=1 Tax=Streptomyces rhizosphaericus TaxID=114699 RepID=A0ABN1SI41_9ACTN
MGPPTSRRRIRPGDSPGSPGARPRPGRRRGRSGGTSSTSTPWGREDIDTVCEIAGPAAKQAEDQGFGPCTSTFVITFQMIPPTQKKALQTATVDPERVVVRTPDKVDMPAESVRSSATFSESDLGTSTLEYIKGKWYITD